LVQSIARMRQQPSARFDGKVPLARAAAAEEHPVTKPGRKISRKHAGGEAMPERRPNTGVVEDAA
jgi:hypothetical protein